MQIWIYAQLLFMLVCVDYPFWQMPQEILTQILFLYSVFIIIDTINNGFSFSKSKIQLLFQMEECSISDKISKIFRQDDQNREFWYLWHNVSGKQKFGESLSIAQGFPSLIIFLVFFTCLSVSESHPVSGVPEVP